jgi:hypothetical protein
MSDEIDKLLAEMDTSNIVVKEDTSLAKKESDIDVEEANSRAKGLVDMVKDDRKKANEIFDLFYTNLAQDTDRSQASKEAITRALELKIEASKNLIELLKIKTRFNESGNKVGLFFGGTTSAEKAGIDLKEIKKNL